MILGTLHRRLFARYLNAEPGDTGGTGTGAPAAAPAADSPAADTPAAPAASAAAPGATPAAPAQPQDPFAGLNDLLDSVGTDSTVTAAGPTPAPKPGATGAPAGAAPAGDKNGETVEEDLTPPEGLNERAQQRFTQLADKVKGIPELERRATEAETQLTQVRTMVNASGLSADEFTDMLETGRLFKSGKPADLQAAMQRLDALRTDIALRLGIDAPGADPLAAHPDLKADVESLALTRERALEIARLRQKGTQADSMTREQQDLQQHQQAVKKGTEAMEAALKARATEPGHAAKLKAIQTYLADPQKKQAFVTTYRPEQWAAALTLMYDAIVVPQAAAPTPAGPQPLRPGNTRAGAAVHNGPVTTESAIDNALASIGQ